MAFAKFYSLIFSFLGLFFLNHVPFSSASTQCLNRKFKPDQHVGVEYFYDEYTRNKDLAENLCKVIRGSNNLISYKNRRGAEVTVNDQGELNCGKTPCIIDRREACFYKSDPADFDQCAKLVEVTLDTTLLANCICDGEADEILIASGKDRLKYQIPTEKLPALVVDGQYDPCLDTTDFNSLKEYFCTSYSNGLPLCSTTN